MAAKDEVNREIEDARQLEENFRAGGTQDWVRSEGKELRELQAIDQAVKGNIAKRHAGRTKAVSAPPVVQSNVGRQKN
jgi:hypothetical protein